MKRMQWAPWAAALLSACLWHGSAVAQVGESIDKSMSRNLGDDDTGGIPPEAEHAFIKYLRTYVPAQLASGAAAPDVEYVDALGTVVKTKPVAKPLIAAFVHGPVEHPEPVGDENVGGFVGFGLRDAFGAVSLDDGSTWKVTNLSESAEQFSSVLPSYPGDVVNIVHAVAGRHIAVAWPSRFCSTGFPAYAMDETERAAIASYLQVNVDADLYLTDLFGVAGSQGSVDYAAQGYPTVGEVPYNCLWTARGVLLDGDDPRTATVEATHVVWYKAERLTSGVRDVNRVEIQMVAGAGVAVIWQEDPEGLLPGQGEGPGEGWSGAIANSQTDTWYSFLPAEHFEVVADATGNPVPLATYWISGAAQPKPYVPFAVPMRLTNNARCLGGGGGGGGVRLYCTETALQYGLKNQCADTVTIPTGQNNQPTQVCVSEDGVPNVANVAATRARLSLQPKLDTLGNVVGAWVVILAEESKGMGRFFFKVGETGVTTATVCTEGDADCQVADDGKDQRYYSFEMGKPATSVDQSTTGLVKNLVSQGNLVNQPEKDWRTGEFFAPLDTTHMWNFISDTNGADYNYTIHRTEIARRGSLVVQPITNVSPGSQLTALLLYKQGLLQQGGPADILARRVINAGTSDNPYDFRNIVCEETLYADGSNPYYPQGICMSPALNLSGSTPKQCTVGGDGNDNSDGICPTIDASGIASDDPTDQTLFDKIESWVQCPGSPECGTFPQSTALGSNFDDQSWYNPLDVAKGHRGYLWRDMVVVMYAWSPNWKRNTRGNDRYELYIRRSFDGGRTWTTTPATWGGSGTTTCEFMRDGLIANQATQVCTDYAAGAAEQARNVSQLQTSDGTATYKFTILDPRYAPDPPTMPSIGLGTTSYDPDSDQFNPTRFFVVYETGDNTTTIDGEPEALDLFYGRAVRFGDHYQVTADEGAMEGTCLPGLTTAGVFCNEFDRLTTGSEVSAEEASLAMSPAGDTLYSVWAQFTTADPLPVGEPLADARYSRVWYTDPYIAWTAPDADPVSEPVIGNGTPYVPPMIFANGFED
jgi:hypothetical protein